MVSPNIPKCFRRLSDARGVMGCRFTCVLRGPNLSDPMFPMPFRRVLMNEPRYDKLLHISSRTIRNIRNKTSETSETSEIGSTTSIRTIGNVRNIGNIGKQQIIDIRYFFQDTYEACVLQQGLQNGHHVLNFGANMCNHTTFWFPVSKPIVAKGFKFE